MEQERRILNLLSLAKKAGRVASGEFSTEKAVKSGKAALVFVSQDASDNTKKKFRNMCEWYKVPIICISDKENLGRSIGCRNRSSLGSGVCRSHPEGSRNGRYKSGAEVVNGKDEST